MPQAPKTLIPDLEPKKWERFEGFRETTLFPVTNPEANQVIRRFADLLSQLIIEFPAWPADSEGVARSMLRAVRADLRYLEGFLAEAVTQCVAIDEPAELALCVFASRLAGEIAMLAERISEELAR